MALPDAYLGLGSNLGDRAANLWEAMRQLGDVPGCSVRAVSRLYDSAPVGPQNQGRFLNAVGRVETTLSPHELLAAAKQIEQQMGRVPAGRWGPRIIDIDLLLYGEERVSSGDLTVPHPELWNRRFVLAPLAELLPAGELLDDVRRRLSELGEEQELALWLGEQWTAD